MSKRCQCKCISKKSIKHAYGVDALSERSCKSFHFKTKSFSLEDEPREGHPKGLDQEDSEDTEIECKPNNSPEFELEKIENG